MYSTKIYYQDTDAGGVVYFANYLKFFEKSWFEHLMEIGISIPEWEKKDTYIMVKTVLLDLLEKLQYGDDIRVTSAIKEVRNAHFVLTHSVFKDGKLTTLGETKMVCVDRTGRLKRMPEELRSILLQNLKQSNGEYKK